VEIHYEGISGFSHSDIHKSVGLDEKLSDFEAVIKLIKRFKSIDGNMAMLEVGTGAGWFEILCKKNGLSCKGLEIDPKLVEHARDIGRKYGVEPDIELGNIEEMDIGRLTYDVIIANSTFEHVEHWRKGLKKIFDALKPGGLFYFYSTNKFSIVQGEYDFPLYSWLPDGWRYRLRIARQGEEIMKNGIDFNQFTYFQLRSVFKQLGFSRIIDRVEILDPNNLNNPKLHKKAILRVLKHIRPLKELVLFFSSGTLFICIK
jgi:SAM-dependent methyltransferase